MAEKLSLEDLEELDLGEEITDWEHDVMIQEQPGLWFYRDQPLRGNTKARGFRTDVVHRAFGPVELLRPKRGA